MKESQSKLFNYNQYGLKIDDLLTTGLFCSIEFLRKKQRIYQPIRFRVTKKIAINKYFTSIN